MIDKTEGHPAAEDSMHRLVAMGREVDELKNWKAIALEFGT